MWVIKHNEYGYENVDKVDYLHLHLNLHNCYCCFFVSRKKDESIIPIE